MPYYIASECDFNLNNFEILFFFKTYFFLHIKYYFDLLSAFNDNLLKVFVNLSYHQRSVQLNQLSNKIKRSKKIHHYRDFAKHYLMDKHIKI